MTALMIAPIGTCRIHAPLRKGVGRYAIKATHDRNYGYVHTSSEALQQLRFMFGAAEIPLHVQALVFRPSTPAQFHENPHLIADLYIVELSSRKRLTIDGHPIQINYMSRYFSDFFADKKRAKMFWAMASAHQMNERRTQLEKDPAFLRLSLEDRELLARIQRRILTDSEMEYDMKQIAELVGKDKLVFVTHVNANTPDGPPLEQRRQLISAVHTIAYALGVPCYDPTPLMHELGQRIALEKGGLDMTHYTDLFSERLCADWYSSFILPRIELSGIQPDSIPSSDDLAHLETEWVSGDRLEASRRLRQVLRNDPDKQEHRILLGRMQYELGDYEGAIAILESVRNEIEANEKTDIVLMRSYFKIANHSNALRFATALLSDEIETPEIVRVCAISAAEMDNRDFALASWKRLFHLAEDKHEAADAVFAILKAADDSIAVANWADEVEETLPVHNASFAIRWHHRIKTADRSGLLELAVEPIELSEAEVLDLIQCASEQGYAMPAAILAAAHDISNSYDLNAIAWVEKWTADWLQKGIESLEADELSEAADKIQAFARINPKGNPVHRAAKRALETRIRQNVRQAFLAKNYQRTVEIIAIAQQTRINFPELDSFLGRSADALGDTKTALTHLKKAAEEDGASILAKTRLARVAFRNGHYLEAIDTYYEILCDQTCDERSYDEAKQRLIRLENYLIRSARDLLAQGEHDRTWALLDRLEKINPESHAVQREKKRLLAALRAKTKSLDPVNDANRLPLGEAILRIAPKDSVGLKVAAVGAMHLHRFPQALQYWQVLRETTDNTTQIDSNIQKCIVRIERASRNTSSSKSSNLNNERN